MLESRTPAPFLAAGSEEASDPGARISDAEFEAISSLIYANFGITLGKEKRSLVAGRLQSLLRAKGGISVGEYCRQVTSDASGNELSELVNRISTNHTFFNREKEHFEHYLRKALPDRLAARRAKGSKTLRIWCAASSTGEEPYMLAMLMREALGRDMDAWDTGILATDISEKALAAAREGRYAPERAAEIPADLRRRWFEEAPGGSAQAGRGIRSDLTFRRFNLMNDRYPFKQPFDIIFCRNVMIYFDAPTREAVVRRMAGQLAPGGYFYIGHSETLGRGTPEFEYVQPACYRRRGQA